MAFPASSTGVYGYPVEQAARVAVNAVRAAQGEIAVTLVAFSDRAAQVLRTAVEGDRG